MELLLAEGAIDPDSECGLAARAMGVVTTHFSRATDPPSPDRSHPGIAVDLGACIRCVQACREVAVNNVIGMAYRGARTKAEYKFCAVSVDRVGKRAAGGRAPRSPEPQGARR